MFDLEKSKLVRTYRMMQQFLRNGMADGRIPNLSSFPLRWVAA